MMKKMVKVLAFVLVCGLSLGGLSNVLRFKNGDGIESLQIFYEQTPDTVDVLCLGSSRTFENINTGVLWDRWGMAAFDLAGSIQPFWNTYYYLDEALKTQSPSVIVLDVYRALETNDYVDQSRVAKNTYAMAGGIEKIEAKRVSSPEEDYLEHLLEFPLYHSRYSDLTKEDFLDHKGIKDRSSWKGFGINYTTKSIKQNPDVSSIKDRDPLSDKTQEYLLRIIQMTKDHNIPLVLVCAPYDIKEADQRKYNSVADIAEDQGIPFLNYNLMYDEVGLDFTGPLSDLASDSHLNHRGNVKYTEHLGAWLDERYDIPDRRSDGRYESWQIDADTNRALIKDQSIRETTNYAEWMKAVSSEDRLTVITTFQGVRSTGNYTAVSSPLRSFGITEDLSSDRVFVVRNGALEYLSDNKPTLWHGEVYGGEVMVKTSAEEASIECLSDDYFVKSNGITALVYDDLTGRIVEVVSWNWGSYDVKTTVSAI